MIIFLVDPFWSRIMSPCGRYNVIVANTVVGAKSSTYPVPTYLPSSGTAPLSVKSTKSTRFDLGSRGNEGAQNEEIKMY